MLRNHCKNRRNSQESATSPPQEHPQNPQASTKLQACKLCGEEVLNGEYFKHMWNKHPDEAEEWRARAQKKHLAKQNTTTESPPDDSKPTKVQKPPPTGIKEIGDLRSRMVLVRLYSDTIYLDTSVVIFYDITRLKNPNYTRTFAEWPNRYLEYLCLPSDVYHCSKSQ